MLRTALQHASVGVERASRSCLPSCSRTVHSGASTSTSSQTSRPSLSRAQVLQFRKEREEKKEIDRRLEELSKPDPVLGHQMNEVGENLWKSSELYQVILSKDEVWGVREDRRGNLLNIEGNEEKTSNKTSENSMPGPKRLNFGLDNEEDRNLLFSDLPSIQLEDRMRKVRDPTMASAEELSFLSEQVQEMEDQEISHVDVLSRVLDLKNASGKGIQVENTRRIIERFGARSEGDERGPDTGSTEVQSEQRMAIASQEAIFAEILFSCYSCYLDVPYS